MQAIAAGKYNDIHEFPARLRKSPMRKVKQVQWLLTPETAGSERDKKKEKNGPVISARNAGSPLNPVIQSAFV